MNTITRRSVFGAIGLIPVAGIAAAPQRAATLAPAAEAARRARAEWHFDELVKLLDEMEPTELHVVLQRLREAQA